MLNIRRDTKMPEKTRTISGGDSESEINYDLFNTSINSDAASIMNSSQISSASCDSQYKTNLNRAHNVTGNSSCRFPKLEECAHFHYERVQLGKLSVRLVIDEKADSQIGTASNASQILDISSQANNKIANSCWYIIRVNAGRSEPFMIKRSFENMKFLDEMLHRCVYDRRISELCNLKDVDTLLPDDQIETLVSTYLSRLSAIASDAMTCGPVLTWLQIDNKGRRLPVADIDTMRCINTPAVGAAYGVRRYVAQACDEISIEVGDMISVIDMPSPAESVWWRGKKSHLQKSQYEVGFFPQSCVATIGDKVPRHMPLPAPLVGSLALSPTKPVLRKHGKLIAFFRSFILARPSRRRLKQSGIYKERVFSCDLGEHLLNSGQDIPMVLKCCAEFIEEYGIVDGIYRLSGITSNIQKLRRAFDEERVPDLTHPDIKQDIHAVSSLLKMYFRELPNPLCTYQLYDHFVDAIQTRVEGNSETKLRMIRQTVQKLPPPHYRTLKYLATHLFKISRYSSSTGMTERNIAIVWAPNLLRSPALESGGVAALRGVGVQAVVTEYLISNCESIFDDSNDDFGDHYLDSQPNSLSDTNSIQIDSRDHDLSISIERPKSLSVGGAKLLSLEEARIRKNCMEGIEKGLPINIINPTTHGGCGSYIEVGGGPSSLPDKYHTVLPVPRSWNKRKSHSSWKSIFSRAPRQSNSNHDMKAYNPTTPTAIEPNDTNTLAKVEQNNVSIIEPTNGVQEKMAKSVDIYDGKSLIVEVCARSNSVDSLRTAGHSRSVSHDSYFDLLQSPLRGVVTCPSRELSELGLNFDREEPEMRIFSESESLVSSPKVAKESIRRTLRARPEEYTSGGNSVNPSPKKQPRLNLQSPTDVIKQWPNNDNQMNPDESLCKRYKLEDQLSDIQFIDCSTPEHGVNGTMNNNTIFAHVQVHRTLNDDKKGDSDDSDLIGTRNSYPGTQYSYVKYGSPIKETRFSYPGVSAKNNAVLPKKYGNFRDEIHVDRQQKNSEIYDNYVYPPKDHATKFAGRYSYYQNSTHDNQADEIHIVPRSCSEDVIRKTEVHKSKLSVMTPQSPVQSPSYSLLVGSTSSDNSSTLNTPVYDMDISNVLLQQQMTDLNTKDNEIKNDDDKMKDINALKRELSLDLNDKNVKTTFETLPSTLVGTSKKSTPNTPNFTSDNTTTTSQSMTPSDFCYQNLNLENSPNVENNDQPFQNYGSKPKVSTPIKSTINITYNLRSPIKKEQDGNIFSSPTISIASSSTPTSPFKHDLDNAYENVLVTSRSDDESTKKLLETNFDETMVYEQVKFYKNAVSEINDLVQEDTHDDVDEKFEEINLNKMDEASQVVPDLELLEQTTVRLKTNDDTLETTTTDGINNNNHHSDDGDTGDLSLIEMKDKLDFMLTKSEEESDDVPMSDINEDSLEFDQNDVSLYENVELRKKPSNVYENVDIKSSIKSNEDDFVNDKSDLDNEMEYKIEFPVKIEIKSKNFSVKQLATKFETSPIEVPPNFDFSQQSQTQNNNNKLNNNRPPSVTIRNKTTKEYQNLANITRSLDENAFVREFGSAKKLENFNSFNKSIHQIPEIDNILNENNPNRRKSLEFTRPKSLNQPKKLPNLVSKDAKDTDCCRKSDLKLDLSMKIEETKEARNYNVRITPTTENRISLVQYNYESEGEKCKNMNSEDDKSITSVSSIKMLGSCKLDRSRIEKIKEERRHQLNEKYRSESFKGEKEYSKLKSKSKSELRDFKDGDDNRSFDSLRFKSKSRVELSDSQQYSLDNSLLSSASLTTMASASEPANAPTSQTNNKITFSNRIRRISDEKNQNDCIMSTTPLPTTGQQLTDATISQVCDNKFEMKTRQKFEKKNSVDFVGGRERDGNVNNLNGKNVIFNRNSQNAQRDRYSPQISIKDVAAMFESRSQNQ